MQQLFKFILLLIFIENSQPYAYEVIGADENFFQTCTQNEGKFTVDLSEYFDVSGLTRTTDSQESDIVYTSGDIVVKKDLPTKIPVQMDLYRWLRGEWIPTIYTAKRDDACDTLFNPKEFWHSMISNIPPVCPPKAGTRFTLQNNTNRFLVTDLPPFINIDGEHKVVGHLNLGSETACLSVRVNIYQVKN